MAEPPMIPKQGSAKSTVRVKTAAERNFESFLKQPQGCLLRRPLVFSNRARLQEIHQTDPRHVAQRNCVQRDDLS